MMRSDGRKPDELRKTKVTPHFQANPSGSCLIEMGGTRVLCSAMIEESVPPFLKGSGKGWLSAEYSMLPGSSSQRIQRERSKVGGRTHEIQRLIGRSLRQSLDLSTIGERSILLDCDVIDADGGTRTAAITGSYIAMRLAIKKMEGKLVNFHPKIKCQVAAISVGMVNGTPVLDLNYVEDKDAEVDMNIVRTSEQKFIEVQGTAESNPFDDKSLMSLLGLASSGINQLFEIQRKAFEV